MIGTLHRTVGLSLFLLSCVRAAGPQSPADALHRGYSTLQGGHGSQEYWIFTPEDPRPPVAPVVVLLHGWGGMDPYLYGAWITHLVLRGHIVIYPRYQTNIKTTFDEMTPGAMQAVQDAYARLRHDGPVRPDPRRLAFVGHSMGGFIAANLAATAAANGLPEPAALMVIAPGDGDGRMRRLGRKLPLVDMSAAPSSLAVLLVTGDKDSVVGDRGAIKIWQAVKHSSISNKSFVTLESIREPGLRIASDHFSPLATDPKFEPSFSLHPSGDRKNPESWLERRRAARRERLIHRTRERWTDRYEPDEIDRNGYWALLDGLLHAAFDSTAPQSRSARLNRWLDQVHRPSEKGSPGVRRRADIMQGETQ